jgi:glycosyltransferase involved in cell wall biosynthesis
LTIHGNMRIIARLNRAPLFSYQWLAARMETYAVPRAGGVVCITRYTQEAMRGRARKTWLLPNATDAGYFTVPAGRDAAGPPVIACAGFVCLRKNQNAFIRALDPVAARHKFRLVFFGEAPKTEAYAQEFFGLLATRPWCEYVGFVNRDQFKEWLGRASLLALPSLEDNCPMTVLEAAATSTPVVAANVGGVPELVEDGRTGLLCDPTSADSMAGAVEKLLTQPALARALATEAHRIALERFHPLPVARGHLKIYREVLQKN